MKSSPIRTVFVATQEADTFVLRGQQIASMRSNWRAQIGPDNLNDADVIVVVKRFDAAFAQALHRYNKPIVLDALDQWQSPSDDAFFDSRDGALSLLRKRLKKLEPDGIICPTEAMRNDIPSVTTIPSVYIPFHVQEGLPRNPLRERVERIGYEGEVSQLGEWTDVFHDVARQLGGHFLVNPVSYEDVDIMVSARTKIGRSYMSRHWKADLKAANAIGSGTPALLMDECGSREIAGSAARYFETLTEIQDGINAMLSHEERKRMAEAGLVRAEMFSPAKVADRYEAFLQTVKPLQQAPLEFTILSDEEAAA